MKNTYFFGANSAEGTATMGDLLGGKGANLAEMTNLGLPIPPGFTISTEVCRYFYDNDQAYPSSLKNDVLVSLKQTEKIVGAKFGNDKNPLLVSVRSGAPVSMPGMMDTVLNLGLNDKTVQGLIKQTGNKRFAYDSYRRFVQMYGNVVQGVDGSVFEKIIEQKKREKNVIEDTDLSEIDLMELVPLFKAKIKKETKKDFPEDVMEQLWGAIDAVFGSWMNERAIVYRHINQISDSICTAVNIQSMVFGNMGDDSATGVAFTRDPSTGENAFFGEYLINAQGEDVVAGIRTPMPISKSNKSKDAGKSMEEIMPDQYKEFCDIQKLLEDHYKDMQDIEFTIQKGKLYILQTRKGKRTARAMMNIAVDFVEAGVITKEEAIIRIDAEKINELLHPSIALDAKKKLLCKGLAASPGVAIGKIVFDSFSAEQAVENGEEVILVRHETSPEDIKGMHVSEGILTARGGMTSHAAVVARGMGRPCIAGADALQINYEKQSVKINGVRYDKGTIITIDGNSGEVMLGEVKTVPSTIDKSFEKVLKWADEIRTINVRTNADTPHDSTVARKFGAEGIGLCRTEHMFFEEDRIKAMREMIVSDTTESRRKALAKLMTMQKADFVGIFKAMDGFPVTVRLLDPPLHEFLPKKEVDIAMLSREMNISVTKLKNHIHGLEEANPMLGHRGCRLGILFPEITEMQVTAILEAACDVVQGGGKVYPEIMVPLVSHVNELKAQRKVIEKVAKEVFEKRGVSIDYMIGTMIELPRAALTANLIATEADFFSFGTNDLTQTAFGLSRDDSSKFLPQYIEEKIFCNDPFVTLDKGGVGRLISIATKDGRAVKPNLKLGICGEHGGDPDSIKLVFKEGVDYVSCSPFRVPVARVAAAQAAIESD